MAIDLLHMRQFVAVAEEQHFGRAAARLGMAQPPLSQAIRRLERALGFSLFERTRRAVALTPAGQVFLTEARCALERADEAVRMARRAASEQLAQLSITFVSAALYRMLPAAIRTFRSRCPEVAIRLDERRTEAQLADLTTGNTDIGFLHPPIENIEGLRVEAIRRDRLIAAVPCAQRLAEREACRLHDLRDADVDGCQQGLRARLRLAESPRQRRVRADQRPELR